MIKINTIIAKSAAIIAAISTLSSCDPCYDINVYLNNSTSQTIEFRSLTAEPSDSTSLYYQKISYIKLKSGERTKLFSDSGWGSVYCDDIPSYMNSFYPNGIMIKFENGDSIVYHQNKVDTDFHSPYDLKSFFSVENSHNFDYEVEAEYNILY